MNAVWKHRFSPFFICLLVIGGCHLASSGLSVEKHQSGSSNPRDSAVIASEDTRPKVLDEAQMAKLESRTDEIEQDFNSLRQLLFDNPDAAITLPLMKKDIVNLQNDMKTTREQFESITSYSKWIIGIMITMSLGVLGLAITAILKK